jgi:anhydro-N-acetylmuramic acid kinase
MSLTNSLGIDADWVEAAAFAWLAFQTRHGLPGNLPAVTGAKGERILGAIYPA